MELHQLLAIIMAGGRATTFYWQSHPELEANISHTGVAITGCLTDNPDCSSWQPS
jgi:hypothetical protein